MFRCSYYSLMAEARGFTPQTMFAITPVSQTIVPSIVWSARCGEIIIISFTRRLPTRSNPLINKKEKYKQQVFVFLFFGGSEGIRTPEPVKTTRFPIVPVMTTSIRFLIFFAYLFANCLYILYFFSTFVNDF